MNKGKEKTYLEGFKECCLPKTMNELKKVFVQSAADRSDIVEMTKKIQGFEKLVVIPVISDGDGLLEYWLGLHFKTPLGKVAVLIPKRDYWWTQERPILVFACGEGTPIQMGEFGFEIQEIIETMKKGLSEIEKQKKLSSCSCG